VVMVLDMPWVRDRTDRIVRPTQTLLDTALALLELLVPVLPVHLPSSIPAQASDQLLVVKHKFPNV